MADLRDDPKLKGLMDALDRKMDEIADFVFTRSQEYIVLNKSVDTGHLLGSGDVVRERLKKLVVYPVPYALPVDKGSGPHRIFSGWIHNWVRRKLKINNEKEIKQAAFKIAKKIEKKGIEARPFATPAVHDAEAKFSRR